MNRVLLVLAGILLIAFGVAAQTTNGLSEAKIEGQKLAWEILQQIPAKNFSETGVVQVQHAGLQRVDVPVEIDTAIGLTNFEPLQFCNNIPVNKTVSTSDWVVSYETFFSRTANRVQCGSWLAIQHSDERPNVYMVPNQKAPFSIITNYLEITDNQTMVPFAGSDFWICDLGLEFFHWPDQKILKHETRRTRECAVLESTNPDPSPGAYSRVDSWIDNETLGIVHAEAYDSHGKLLKVFDPKSFKKVNGQWELQDMEIRNVQTGSRTWIKFDLK